VNKSYFRKSSFIRQLIYRQGRCSVIFPLQRACGSSGIFCCRYPASRGISRAVPKVLESSTGGAGRTDQLSRQPRLVFIIAHIKIAYRKSPFSVTAESIYRHTPFPNVPDKRTFTVFAIRSTSCSVPSGRHNAAPIAHPHYSCHASPHAQPSGQD
jgi:hypothetical protein